MSRNAGISGGVHWAVPAQGPSFACRQAAAGVCRHLTQVGGGLPRWDSHGSWQEALSISYFKSQWLAVWLHATQWRVAQLLAKVSQNLWPNNDTCVSYLLLLFHSLESPMLGCDSDISRFFESIMTILLTVIALSKDTWPSLRKNKKLSPSFSWRKGCP